jgi:hypothetical protein
MRRRTGFLLLAFLAATPQVRYFRYERAVNVPHATAGAAASQTCAVLDAGLFAHAAAGLADVRVYRSDTLQSPASHETPYAIWEEMPKEGQLRQIAPLNLGRKGAHTTFEAVMPEGRYKDVELDISAKNFIATVAVTGASDEGGREGTELGLFTVFDLTGQKLGRSTVLHLPESDLKYLYFSIEGAVKPEDVHGITVERAAAAPAQYVTVAQSFQTTQNGHKTVLQFRVPAHVPVDRIVFVPGAEPANFSRAVTVSVVPPQPLRSDQEPLQPVEAAGDLLRVHRSYDGRRIDDEHLTLDAPQAGLQTAESLWTITIDNGDDPPVDLESVRLEMVERKLCFDSVAGAGYTLMYGDPPLSAPRYDYASLFAPEKDALAAALGGEHVNPGFEARPDTRPFTERYPWLLWLALVVVVAVLGLVAVKTARDRVRAT